MTQTALVSRTCPRRRILFRAAGKGDGGSNPSPPAFSCSNFACFLQGFCVKKAELPLFVSQSRCISLLGLNLSRKGISQRFTKLNVEKANLPNLLNGSRGICVPSGLRKINRVPMPFPKATLTGYIIVMGFLIAFFVGALLPFSRNPFLALSILIIILVAIALITLIFVKLFVGLDQHREST